MNGLSGNVLIIMLKKKVILTLANIVGMTLFRTIVIRGQ